MELIVLCYVVKNIAKYLDILLLFNYLFILFVAFSFLFFSCRADIYVFKVADDCKLYFPVQIVCYEYIGKQVLH